ncbi:MAG: hypothetical protein L0387_38565 [Acidobacteria bacterium]|nr:hypothetical protein [Acidobacteriota bacterium]
MLFQEYVDWLLKGIDWGPEVIYQSSPRFEDCNEEALDGLLLKGGTLFALEYKGGFVSQSAKYSLDKSKMMDELEKKFVTEGCCQLVSTLTKLFGISNNPRHLRDIPVDHVERVAPILIVQDHILRGPFVNWWLNKRFQDHLDSSPVKRQLQVLPLTVVNVHELESMVQSAEASSFDIPYALHHRAVRDPQMLSILKDSLMQLPGFGSKEESERWKAIRTAIQDEMFSYLFPEEWMKEKHAN